MGKRSASCGVRTHARLRIVVLKTTPLDHSGKLAFRSGLNLLITLLFKSTMVNTEFIKEYLPSLTIDMKNKFSTAQDLTITKFFRITKTIN